MKQTGFYQGRNRQLGSFIFITLAAIAMFLFSCVHKEDATTEPNREPNNYQSSAGSHDTDPTIYLDQNWTPEEREAYYRTPQGSHMMPLKFAIALEQRGSEKKFFTNEHLSTYGFIPQKGNAATNPYALPVGFTVDGGMGARLIDFSLTSGITGKKFEPREVGERQLGINCAACHTANLKYEDKTTNTTKLIRLDGGQGFVDIQKFFDDMDGAVAETAMDNSKLDRMISTIKGWKGDFGSDIELRNEFVKFAKERSDWQKINKSSFMAGPGRVDAFSIIFNQVLARDLGIFSNHREPVNPVSFPVVWDGPHHDYVQWNGLASNDPANGGPLARNTGEVLGVFGSINFHNQTVGLDGYCSTVRRYGLEELEKWLTTLTSPKWPTVVLGELDQAKVIRGRTLFEKTCQKCHTNIVDRNNPNVVVDRTNPNRLIKATLVRTGTVGTDPKFNENALSWEVDTGLLEGRKSRVKEGRPLEKREPAATVLKHAVAGAMIGTISPITCSNSIEVPNKEVLDRWVTIAGKIISNQKSEPKPDDHPDKKIRTEALVKTLDVYKARPLNGIWSSAPFLHNGSVKSLYELLLPPERRAKEFYTGCEKFDKEKVGVDCSKDDDGVVLYNAKLKGNKPMGHKFGTRQFSDADRMDVIEYIKSL